MSILSWFSWSKPTDFETVLSELASQIAEAKLSLSEIRLRERRYILLVTSYSVTLWAVWTGLWFVGMLPWWLLGWRPGSTKADVAGLAGVVAGPILIWALNRIVSYVFGRQRTREENHLRSLLKKQRAQIDEIKKITNYDSTRKLIEQYDTGVIPATPQRPGQPGPQTPQRPSPQTPTRPGGELGSPLPDGTPGAPQGGDDQDGPGAPGAPGTPRAPGHLVGAGGTPGLAPSTPVPVPHGISAEQAAFIRMQMQNIQPVLPTPEKKWYDRLADSILGDDPTQAPQNKYALVCAECFTHNGLIGSKYEWERMQWICPRCKHLNPAPLSRAQAELTGVELPEPETPSKPPPVALPVTPTGTPGHLRASPRPRRQLGERKAAPRLSRLGNEVFSADDIGEDEGGDSFDDDAMEVDK
ncbi:Endoplasmic reticulum junction formation protein lunapark [Vanrija pseudolonga]|uniref:Endoplasmic reticulum junction formation protein lunapark n=1 Tax=Vanrija pseudolonga TaxID=143232 RepID=A0AAF0Y6C3_9TREE|nr:Endoplasmic reticulum junction formation protein lunapark [Vanrija pseudolonga]